jgi:hypothetical protein
MLTAMNTTQNEVTGGHTVARTKGELCKSIGIRAAKLAAKYHVDYKAADAALDVLLCHNSTPLRLEELLAADDGNFGHDVFGIRRHLDRKGNLTGCFLPRYAI